MGILLSFILPCYGVEKYVACCLDSIFTQGIPEAEFEVLCIDDCSPDGTADIIKKYREQHPNLFLLEHEINKKQGGARNTGLNAARGEYIWFVDPDDLLQPHAAPYILDLCLTNEPDILQFNYRTISDDGKYLQNKLNVPDSFPPISTGLDFIHRYLTPSFPDQYDLSVWSRIHRTAFLKNLQMRFIENTIFEDLEFSLRSLVMAEKIQSISGTYYNYRNHPASVTQIIRSSIDAASLFQITIVIGKGIIDLASEIHNRDHLIGDILLKSGKWRLNHFTKSLIKANLDEKRKFFLLLRMNSVITGEVRNHLGFINKIIVNHLNLSEFMLVLFHPFIVFGISLKNQRAILKQSRCQKTM